MIVHFNPVAFSFFGLSVRWYGLVYIAGFFLSLYLGRRFQKKILSSPLSKDAFENLTFGIFLWGVVGGRLGEFLFYHPSLFLTDFWEIFKVWHGGMSIHGGLLGAIFFILYFSRKHKISFLSIGDTFVIPLAITLIFGRIANFINGELVGIPTHANWGVIFPNIDNQLRYPSQLYESAKNLFLTAVLFFLYSKEAYRNKGMLTVVFLSGYGILRFALEFFREPDGIIGPISTGQALSLVMIVTAGVIAYTQKFWRK